MAEIGRLCKDIDYWRLEIGPFHIGKTPVSQLYEMWQAGRITQPVFNGPYG